ncbi:hypothetical protein VPH35_044428 [Triticum aestivum]
MLEIGYFVQSVVRTPVSVGSHPFPCTDACVRYGCLFLRRCSLEAPLYLYIYPIDQWKEQTNSFNQSLLLFMLTRYQHFALRRARRPSNSRCSARGRTMASAPPAAPLVRQRPRPAFAVRSRRPSARPGPAVVRPLGRCPALSRARGIFRSPVLPVGKLVAGVGPHDVRRHECRGDVGPDAAPLETAPRPFGRPPAAAPRPLHRRPCPSPGLSAAPPSSTSTPPWACRSRTRRRPPSHRAPRPQRHRAPRPRFAAAAANSKPAASTALRSGAWDPAGLNLPGYAAEEGGPS